MTIYHITETSNGFVLDTEWDCDEGGTSQTTIVFEEPDGGELTEPFDRMVKFIREKYQD